MVRISRVLIAVAAAGLLVSGCSVKKTEQPALAGPSELGLSVNLTANPDILTQDGSSQSRIVILALDANGQAVKGLPVHLGVTGQGLTLFGLLSSTDVVTGSDGRATVLYTAPPLPPDSVDRGALVTISAVPTGTDFANAVARLVNIRLVPPTVVTPPPVASFTFSPSTAMPNSPVTFDASASRADNGIASYTWNFGDGTTGTGVNPQHTYGREGTYTVSLVVMDNTGRVSYTCTRTVPVATGAAPIASFVFSPTSPGPNQTVFFNASSSTAGNGRTLTDYAWDFGNGESAHGVTATATYASAGAYTVTLVVTDDADRTSSKSAALTVATTSSSVPTASFVSSPSSPSPGQTVLFNASGSTAGTGRTLTSYNWDFGNGLTGSGVTDSTSYSSAGTYTVTLLITDDIGQTASKSQSVTVTAGTVGNPSASFVFSPAAPAVGDSIVFDASTSTAAAGHTINSYAWTFGDGTAGTGRTHTKTGGYGVAGSYAVMLTVTDDLGHTASTSSTVSVATAGAPTAAFSVSPSPATVGVQVVVDASTSTAVGGTIVAYEWNFGDATTIFSTTTRTFTHSYALAGVYSITLTVTDSNGRKGSTAKSLTVSGVTTPTASFSFTPSPGVVGTAITFTPSAAGGTAPYRYEWTFGDSTQIFLQTGGSIDHTYAAAATYNVTLTVTDSVGAQATISRAVIVQALAASFTVSPSPGVVGGAINFDASASVGPHALRYSWTFGDSSTVYGGTTTATISHTYSAAGAYTITLTVTDTVTGDQATTTRTLTIQ